jgi:hypothetical protein
MGEWRSIMSKISLEDAMTPPDEEVEPSPEAETDPKAEASGEEKAEGAEETSDEGVAPDELPRDVKGLQKALAVSRAKSRDMEAQLQHINGRLHAYERLVTSPTAPPTPESIEDEKERILKEFADNPKEFLQNQVVSVAKQLKLADDTETQREKHKDFDETTAIFVAEAQKDPHLLAQFGQASNQARFAYTRGKEIQEFRNLGVSTYAEFREKVTKQAIEEFKAKGESTTDDAVSRVPASTITAKGGGRPSNQAFAGPPPLEKLLPM